MTKVQLQYDLARPLDDVLLDRISAAHGIYGFQRIQVTAQDKLFVEYDASRLSKASVVAALHGAGIPVVTA